MDGGKQKSTAELAKLGWSQATTSSLVKWATINAPLLSDGAFLLLSFLFPFASTSFIFLNDKHDESVYGWFECI
jgi:hypothetical protein